MSDDTQQPIVVKRIKKGGGGHHGGAWKIAYADFVTAMMAFFLLMWLLGSTAQGDLEGIADYFQNPLKLAMQGGEGSGDSSSIIKGGGEDLSRSVGQVRRGEKESTRAINLDAAPAHTQQSVEGSGEEVEARRERAKLIDLQGRIEALIEASATLREFKNQILIDIVNEGLRIQLVDEQNRPMFTSASADLRPYTRDLLRSIGRSLNDVENRISVSGHTDSVQYAGGDRGFSNWELSSNRANASRRELVAGGLEAGKFVRVVGLADTMHLNRSDPLDPVNRRISIIVLNKRAEEAIRNEGSKTDAKRAPPGSAS
jgi:chemotaxis protein MotB